MQSPWWRCQLRLGVVESVNHTNAPRSRVLVKQRRKCPHRKLTERLCCARGLAAPEYGWATVCNEIHTSRVLRAISTVRPLGVLQFGDGCRCCTPGRWLPEASANRFSLRLLRAARASDSRGQVSGVGYHCPGCQGVLCGTHHSCKYRGCDTEPWLGVVPSRARHAHGNAQRQLDVACP